MCNKFPASQGPQRFRKPERSMGMMVGEMIAQQRHRYKQVESVVAIPKKAARLSATSFGKVPVEGVASSSLGLK